MIRIWQVTIHTIRDGVRRGAWIPFGAAALLGVLSLLMGFGYKLKPNPYANVIISGFFHFWTLGTLMTTIYLGATTIPTERRTPALFTLPLARWEIIAGKLIGTQVLTSCFLVAGYLISIGLAMHANLPILAHSLLGLAAAWIACFVCLCLSVPLGVRMPAVLSGTLTIIAINLAPQIEALADASLINRNWFVKAVGILSPWQIPGVLTRYAFFDGPNLWAHYSALGGSALWGFVILIGLTALLNRTELSMK